MENIKNTRYCDYLPKNYGKTVINTNDINNSIGISIGMKAPNFNSITTHGECSLSDYKGKWCVFFSYPSDFNPVCTTELLSFSKYNDEFNKRNCYLLGTSINNLSSHLAFFNNIYNLTSVKIPFPVIADVNMNIAKLYNMLCINSAYTYTYRCVYIIDPNQTIRAILHYPLTNGRCIPEILRLLDSLIETDTKNCLTPAGWLPQLPSLKPSPTSFDELLECKDSMYESNCLDWYLCFKDNN